MKAMIFAAGIGTRLKPWTLHHPKALVEVGGKPMLGRVIDRLRDAGIHEIVVNVHHFAPQIVDYLNNLNDPTLTITIADESQLLLDTGGGLLAAAPLLGTDSPILLHNADILTDFPLEEMMEAHARSGADATLLVDRRSSSRCLYFDGDGTMRGWGNLVTGATRPEGLDTSALTPLAFGGVHIVNPATIFPLLREFAPGEVFSITDFYIAVCDRASLRAYTPSAPYRWHDVGRPESLEAARAAYASK